MFLQSEDADRKGIARPGRASPGARDFGDGLLRSGLCRAGLALALGLDRAFHADSRGHDGGRQRRRAASGRWRPLPPTGLRLIPPPPAEPAAGAGRGGGPPTPSVFSKTTSESFCNGQKGLSSPACGKRFLPRKAGEGDHAKRGGGGGRRLPPPPPPPPCPQTV